jgi:hypothetical protein
MVFINKNQQNIVIQPQGIIYNNNKKSSYGKRKQRITGENQLVLSLSGIKMKIW